MKVFPTSIFESIRKAIVISNRNGKIFILKLSYSKKYLSKSKLKMAIKSKKPRASNNEEDSSFQRGVKH